MTLGPGLSKRYTPNMYRKLFIVSLVLTAVISGCATREFTIETARAGAERGDARAEFFLGKRCARGEGVPQDYAKAAEYFRQAAAQGYAPAENGLGALYVQGTGVSQDYAEAVKWFQQAAAKGDPRGELNLGRALEAGRGVVTNMAEAMEWYRRAAAQGLLEAELELGGIYLGGRGWPADYNMARTWYEKAAQQHSAIAINALGVIFEEGGPGVPKDLTKAVGCFRQAALAGDGKGLMNLGRMYLQGSGVTKDPVEAYKWFYLATRKSGGAGARHYLEQLEGKVHLDLDVPELTAEQRQEAIRRVNEFQASNRKSA